MSDQQKPIGWKVEGRVAPDQEMTIADVASLVGQYAGGRPSALSCADCDATWQFDEHGVPYLGAVRFPCERCGSRQFVIVIPAA